jgi:hypothetical protein
MCSSWSLHHLWYFCAGAAFWDALVHTGLHLNGLLPLSFYGFTITTSANYLLIGFAAFLCCLFLYLGHASKCRNADQKCCETKR